MNCKLSRNKIGALVISILTAFSFSGVEASIVSAAGVIITRETQQLDAGLDYCIADIDGLFALARLVNTGKVDGNEDPYDDSKLELGKRLERVSGILYLRGDGPCICLINDLTISRRNCNNFEPIGRFESIETRAVTPSAAPSAGEGGGGGGETEIDNQLEAIDDDDDDDDDGDREDYWTRQNKKKDHPSGSSSPSPSSSSASSTATSSPSPSSSSTSSSSSSAPLVSAPVAFSEEGNPCVQFNANFDGCGHTITLEQFRKSTNNVALFGCIGRPGVVCNLKIAGTLQGINSVGGIAAINYGLISHCTNSAIITSTGDSVGTGGIAADNYGELCNCDNISTVKGKYNVGGILGTNHCGGLVFNVVHKGQVVGMSGVTGGCLGVNVTDNKDGLFLAFRVPGSIVACIEDVEDNQF